MQALSHLPPRRLSSHNPSEEGLRQVGNLHLSHRKTHTRDTQDDMRSPLQDSVPRQAF